MRNIFKKKTNETEEIKEEFIIGNYDFSFDREKSTIEINGNEIIDLTIKSDENIFDELCEKEDFEFGFGIYSPEFYAREINLGKKGQIVINEENQNDYETAVYFMEHNDLNINLSLHPNWILIVGWTKISGKEYPISIKMKR
ncbi:hypothetical protein ACKGJY_15485 [Hyunsoonleella sp. 2307UL5-6]|uniref:hypothetical protein n=1 Tax=Hyunsoonleella sp. 2307UL5-6 TaxID=3384768 RepID=UPI0039BD1BFC